MKGVDEYSFTTIDEAPANVRRCSNVEVPFIWEPFGSFYFVELTIKGLKGPPLYECTSRGYHIFAYFCKSKKPSEIIILKSD